MPRTPLAIREPSDVDKLVMRASTLGTASDALWRAINADVASSAVADRFSHPLSSVAFRVEREASKAARVAQAAQRILARSQKPAETPPQPETAVPPARVPEPAQQPRNQRRR